MTLIQVMIYRLVTRGSIEERMMQMTKKKMVLEHVVVGRMKGSVNLNQVRGLNDSCWLSQFILITLQPQEELDDILRYGSKELFEKDEKDNADMKRIQYDEAAVERCTLIDCGQLWSKGVNPVALLHAGFWTDLRLMKKRTWSRKKIMNT